MMFIIFDEQGDIQHSIVGPDESYRNVLDGMGYSYLVEPTSQIEIHEFFVDVASKLLCQRADMNLVVDKVEIAANGLDAAVISGIPMGGKAVIECSGVVQTVLIDDGRLEFTASAAARYAINITAPRYRPYFVEVIAS